MSFDQSKLNLVTVGLTDFYHAGALKDLIHRGQWSRFETRIEQNTLKTLDLLDRCNTKATIFVMGWVAERQPELIREVAKRGHEIANMGFYQRSVREMTRSEFTEDLKRSQAAIEDAGGVKIFGYRLARPLFRPTNLWVLDVLAEAGYAYDSSIFPLFRFFGSEPWRRFPHQHRYQDHVIWEFPCSTWKFFGNTVPISGGNYFRQLPHRLMKLAVTDWIQKYDTPFLMYFHVWDLDPHQPKISSASPLVRMRAYRNLDKMSWIIEDYLRAFRFGTIAGHLGILNSNHAATAVRDIQRETSVEVKSKRPESAQVIPTSGSAIPASVAPELTIVVPCFNEEPVLPYLRNTLRSVRQSLEKKYKILVIFVDDGSTDGTWHSLQDLFGAQPDCTLVQQPANRGVTAAIVAGILAARTELVCSIDCDCTYDPLDLERLVPRLTEGVDLVTGSPYHPEGRVFNVPRWRLALSKTASALYRLVLRNKLHTYTSCFRVYRRSAVVDLSLREDGFLGVAELLGRLDLKGSRIVECPTTLEVRILGESKMKTARTIAGHLRLLTILFAARLKQEYSTLSAGGVATRSAQESTERPSGRT
jgi:polysaccharide deacetylase family protein (PEP-CTERM system associated)